MSEDYEQQQYEDPQPEPVSGGPPEPSQFDDYDLYVKAMVDWKVRQVGATPTAQAVAQGVVAAMDHRDAREAQRQAELGRILPDDETREDKLRLLQQMEEYAFNEKEAKERGDKKSQELWHYHTMDTLKQIKALPKSQAEVAIEEAKDEFERSLVKKLTDPAYFDHPAWPLEKTKHDAAIKVTETNKRAKTEILLPREYSTHGTLAPMTPENTIVFNLPEKVMKAFKDEVYNKGGSMEPEAILKRSWSFLHREGYDSSGEFAHDVADRSGGTKNPEEMTQAEFNAWREEQEAERRGGPKTGFILPKAR